jgi:hypothetical protein
MRVFYPFAFLSGCPGAGLVLANNAPRVWGVLRRLNCLRFLPQVSRLRSTRLMRSATVRTAHACSKVFTYGKAPGLRTNAVCGKYNAVCLKLMRTVSQLLKNVIPEIFNRGLIPTIYQKDPGASAPHSYATGLGGH